MEGGVEAGHLRHLRQRASHELERTQRLRLMQRREIRERLDSPNDVVVDHHRLDELRSAVDDAKPDRVDAADVAELASRPHEFVAVEHRELQAARARVDDEDLQCGQTHSRTAGGSSPSMRVYARAWTRSSSIR